MNSENSIERSNLELFKSQSEDYLCGLRRALTSLIMAMPREEVIRILKNKKIIKHDYCKSEDDIVIVERI